MAAVLLMGGTAAAATPPNPPANLTVSSSTKTSLTLNWTPSGSTGVAGYTASVNGVNFGNVSGANATSMTITGLTCGGTYRFTVVAFDSSGNTSSAASVNGSTSICEADLAIVSNTPSVTQAQVGDQVTFTIVATNYGPDPTSLYVHVDRALSSLRGVSLTCDRGISPDGAQCEYSHALPGDTLTTTLVAEVLDTGSSFASDVACVSSGGLIVDPPGNDCGIGTVGITTPQPPPPPPSAPVNTAAPRIIGAPVIGSTLVEANGEWTNSPTSFGYQWQRCDGAGSTCAAIAGATNRWYTPTSADAGDAIRVQEWATNAGGTGGPADSVPTAVVTAPSTVPPTSPPPVGASPAPPAPVGGSPAPPVSSPSAVSGGTGPVTASTARIEAQLLGQLAPTGGAAKIAALLKNGGYTFSFHAFGAGRVVIGWYYLAKGATLSNGKHQPVVIATGQASFTTAKLVKLTIKLSAAGKRMLKATKRLRLTAKGTYVLRGQPTVTAGRTFALSR